MAQAVAERTRAVFVLIDGGVFQESAQLINERKALRTSRLQSAEAAERRGMRVNQVDGFLLQQLENPVSDEPDNRGFAQDRLAPRNGPFGKLAAKRCPAVSDIFHDGFRGVRIISVLERTCQGLRTGPDPVLRRAQMRPPHAIPRIPRP